MKTDKPYAQWAHCSFCWYRWPYINTKGWDEDAAIKCPSCNKITARIGEVTQNEINGDALREIFKRYDAEKQKQKEEGGEDQKE